MDTWEILLSISLLCITFLLFQSWQSPPKKLPPGPAGIPILGNLLLIGARPHESLATLAKAYGPLMTLRLGLVTTIVASSPEMAQEILQKHDQLFAGRTIPDGATAEPHYEHCVAWLPPGPHWRSMRKIFNTQIFTTQRLDALQLIRDKKVKEMVCYVTELAATGKPVDIGRLAIGTILNLVSSTVFSIDLVDHKSQTAQEFKDMMGRIMEYAGKPNLSDYYPFLRRFDIQGIRKHMKGAYDYIHVMVDDLIEQRLLARSCGETKRNDFLDVLLDYREEEHDSKFDRISVKVLITDLFIAGGDTSATSTEWVMAEVLRHPGITRRVQQELIDIVGSGRQVQESDIPRLPYLQAVVKEAMRLHPTVPLLLPHRAEADVELCRYVIPKHAQVFVNVWAIARDGSHWENPESFVPERFLDSEADFRGPDLRFIPFGAGRRMCPGLPLALRMIHLMVASLVHSFDWELPGGCKPEQMDMADKFGVTLQKAAPLVAIPTKRLAESCYLTI